MATDREPTANGVATPTWRAVVEGALDAIVIADERGRVTGWNPQAEATFGWSADEAIGRSVADVVVPDDMRDAHSAGWSRYMRTGVPHVLGQRIELTAKHREGHTMPVELTVSTHVVDGQKVFSAAIRDISQRVAAQAKIDRQADGLRVLNRIATGREQDIGRLLERAITESLTHLGAEAVIIEQVESREPRILASGGDVEALAELAANATAPITSLVRDMADEPATAGTLHCCCASAIEVRGAEYGSVSFWSRAAHDPANAEGDHDFVRLLGGWLGAALERHGAMAAQRESEASIRTLQQTSAERDLSLEAKVQQLLALACGRFGMSTGVLAEYADGGYRVVVASGDERRLDVGTVMPADEALAEELRQGRTSLAVADLESSSFRDHPAAQRHGLRAYMGVPITVGGAYYGSLSLSAFEAREPFEPAEEEFLRLLAQWVGRELENRDHVVALAEANRELEELVVSTRALAEDAQAASRAKSDFLAVMSHEMRTPMNGVLGILDLLAQEPLEHEQRIQVGLATESGKSLVALIDEILDFSRIEAGKLTIEPVPFAMDETVNEQVGLIAAQAVRRGVSVDVHVDADVPPIVVGPELRVRQVVGNLLGNAVKFTERGRITVSADVVGWEGERVVIRTTVADTGTGVPAELVDELFEPFTQGDASSTRRHGGTGLGLAISRRLVERMGGRIEYEPLEDGSAFWFEVPYEVPSSAADAQAPPREATSTEAAQQAGDAATRVLVVEDHPVNQAVTVRMLERLGVESSLAENGEEALDRLARERFDLVLMDCRMPVLDGYAATTALRQREAEQDLERTPVVALTANALPEERRRCLDAGMDDYLAKPISTADLEGVVAKWAGAAPDDAANGDHKPPQTPTADVFDAGRLEESSGGDQDLEAELLATLARESDALGDRIRSASAAGDTAAVADAAHALKGSAATLGFTALSEAALAVERAAKAGDDVAPLLPTLEAHQGDPRRIASTRS